MLRLGRCSPQLKLKQLLPMVHVFEASTYGIILFSLQYLDFLLHVVYYLNTGCDRCNREQQQNLEPCASLGRGSGAGVWSS